MKYILVIILLISVNSSHAQLTDWLKQKKEQAAVLAKQKAEQKLDEKINTGIGKSIETVDSVLTGKKKLSKKERKELEKKQQQEREAAKNNANESNATETEHSPPPTVIKTNINCDDGKAKVIAALKELEGVFDVKIDIKTGNLTIAYSSDGTPYTVILSTINESGFDADKQKSTNTSANPCNSETEENTDEETKDDDGNTVIKTNINCANGKTKVIAALKELEGVFDVKIDIKTGKLTISYSSDGTPYTIILSTINENGFVANGQKPAKTIPNPCNIRN